jgi:ribonuclease R
MPKKKENTESKILKLFAGNTEKTFSFETLLHFLPKKTRKEKLFHALDILKRQGKIREPERFQFQLLEQSEWKVKEIEEITENAPEVKKKKEIKKEDLKPKSKFIPQSNAKYHYEAKIDISSNGAVFAIVEGMDKDAIFRQKDGLKVFNGDRAIVEILPVKEGKRPEANLIRVVERNVESIIGKVHQTERDTFVDPLSRKVKNHFYINYKHTKGAKNGDFVVVEFLEWNEGEKNPRGKVVEILNNISKNNIEMKSILLEKGFQQEFDEAVLEELKAVNPKIEKSELSYREDFRKTLTFTIDPVDAKDFDDAISYKKIDENHYELGVHIADVSHYVKPNTLIDDEAYKRATSVYLPDRVAPMLPEMLSNNLCSLNPNVERYAFAVIFDVDAKGKILNERICKTIIKSDRRYTYEEAQDIIETQKGDFAEEILFLDKISKIWRVERYKKGAISFVSPEVRFRLDEDGVPIEVYEKVQKDSNLLIEDFMLKANVSVAKFLSDKVKDKKIRASVYRNHDLPSMERLEQFRETAFRLGQHKIQALEDANKASTILNNFLEEIKNSPEAAILNQLAIRSMAKAYYGTENIGHYGLAYDFYTHFTSPIRRYPDLLVHRLLESVLYGSKTDYPRDLLEMKCQHCSQQEKFATECEREGIKYKQVEYLSTKIGEEFTGIISGAIQAGFWVELSDNKCEGFVEIQKNFREPFEFDAQKIGLVSRNGKDSFFYGDEVRIIVQKVNLEEKKIWFKLTE